MNFQIGPGPTIKDVARTARVSVGTVSRVLNDDPTVRPPMRDAVERAIKKLHYTPNLAARGLRSSRTQTIGILVPDLRAPRAADAIRGCEEAAEPRGYSVLIADARGSRERQQRQAQLLVAKRVDGLLYAPLGSPREVIDAVQGAGIPASIVGVPLAVTAESTAAAVAAIDASEATAAALQSLISAGHRHLALVSVDAEFSRVRLDEVVRIAEQLAPDLPSLRKLFGPEPELAALVTEHLRPRGNHCNTTALLVMGVESLPAALVGIREAGRQLGADVSVVAIEDSKWAAALTPPLDAVAFDWYRHLAEATDVLLDTIDGGPIGRVLVHRSEYVERGLVCPVPAAF